VLVAIAGDLVVRDATASPPPRFTITPRKPPPAAANSPRQGAIP